jgi:hypothetical protein
MQAHGSFRENAATHPNLLGKAESKRGAAEIAEDFAEKI